MSLRARASTPNEVKKEKKRTSLYRLYHEPHPKTCVMLVSWPGIGNVSLIVARYLKDALDAQEIGEIDPIHFFEPVGVVVENNVVEAPHFPESKFYYWQDDNAEKGLVLFIGEEQPGTRGYELASNVLDVAKKLKVQRVYSCAAAVTRVHYGEESKVWGVATKNKLIDGLKEYDVVLKDKLHIAGLNGLILGMAKERNIEGICLLGEVPLYATQLANPKASLAVLRVLTKMLDIDIDFTALSRVAKQTEEEMERIAKRATAEFIDQFTEPIWEQGEEEDEEED